MHDEEMAHVCQMLNFPHFVLLILGINIFLKLINLCYLLILLLQGGVI
jgi:hypothetical protein